MINVSYEIYRTVYADCYWNCYIVEVKLAENTIESNLVSPVRFAASDLYLLVKGNQNFD